MKPATTFSPPHWDSRQPVLNASRQLKMTRSAHAFVRGSTLKFYEWLDAQAVSSLPAGPAVWICGDCHLSNIGPVANANGEVELLVRDFDQTVIGNPAHDLIRLGLSLTSAARGSDLPGVTTARMLEQLVEGYVQAFLPRSKARMTEPPAVIAATLRDARTRSWRQLARDRVGDDASALPKGRRFWPLSPEERDAIDTLIRTSDVLELTRLLPHRPDDGHVQVVDAAYWLKGCSSLGRLRHAVLVDIAGKSSKGRDFCLIDIKEATKAAAPRDNSADMPRDNAERVLTGAREMSPHLGERMVAARLLDRSVTLRELMPQDLKLEIDRLSSDEAVGVARYLAQVVGRAHAGQLDKASRRAWAAELARNHTRSIDVPSWLWRSVVDLVATHERAYLEHCRRFALGDLAGAT